MADVTHAIEQLERIKRDLEIAHAAVVVAAAAALRQRAEQDEEIAAVLRHCAAPRLFEQIDRIDELAAALRAGGPGGEEPSRTQ